MAHASSLWKEIRDWCTPFAALPLVSMFSHGWASLITQNGELARRLRKPGTSQGGMGSCKWLISNADSNGNDYTFRGGPEHKTSIPFSFSALEHAYNPLEFNSRKNNANMWQIKHRNFTFLGDVFVAVSILLMVTFKLLFFWGGGRRLGLDVLLAVLGAVCCLIMKHNKRHTGN